MPRQGEPTLTTIPVTHRTYRYFNQRKLVGYRGKCYGRRVPVYEVQTFHWTTQLQRTSGEVILDVFMEEER